MMKIIGNPKSAVKNPEIKDEIIEKPLGKYESTKLKDMKDPRDFAALARLEVGRVISMVGKSIDKCLENGGITEETAEKMMKDWILMVNARMSVAETEPSAVDYDDFIDKLIIKPEGGKSFLVLKSEWESLTEAERKEVMKNVKDKKGHDKITTLNKAIDVTSLTLGQLEACCVGNLNLCLNAGKHITNGKLKESDDKSEFVRKFSIVNKDNVMEAIKLISQKTYIKWLNSIISTDGSLVQRFQPQVQAKNTWKKWSKPMKNSKARDVMVYESILISLINNTRSFKPGNTGQIKVGIFAKTARNLIFGCYQIARTQAIKVGTMFALSQEAKDAYVKANVIVPLDSLTSN